MKLFNLSKEERKIKTLLCNDIDIVSNKRRTKWFKLL